MTETKRTVDKELAGLDEEIASMEAELAEIPGSSLTWDEVTEEAVKELEAKERRCSILPRLITAAKVKRLELERAREERLAKPFEEEQTAAYERIQEATAAKLKADEDLGVARAAWGDAHMRFENRRRRIKEIDREIAALKGEA